MKESAVGFDAGVVELIEKPIVEVEALGVGRAVACRKDARPGAGAA